MENELELGSKLKKERLAGKIEKGDQQEKKKMQTKEVNF